MAPQAVSELAAQLRARAQKLIQAAELIEQSEDGQVQLSDVVGKVGRFSADGMERLRRFNQEKWLPCPKNPPCQTRDKRTGQMRIKKHRAAGKGIHPHMKGAQTKEIRRSA